MRRPGSPLSTSFVRASAQAAIPTGTLTRSTSRHPSALTRKLPSDGPVPAASAAIAVSKATACARRSAG